MLAPGVVLQQRYQIVGPIAQGGVGAVYQATDQRLRHTVAIKQIMRNEAMLRAAFEQEARLLAALRHPALPNVTDHFVEPSGQFLVMEFIAGDDLATLALRQQQPLAVDKVLRWADQLLDLLTYLHSRTPPVIHRDIKPHNMKLNAQGEVILLDFGLAKGAPGSALSERSIAGYTLHYAPPEQLRGEQSDDRSDLYALAATLYDLLAAVKPPDAIQRLAALAAGQPDPLQPLHTRNLAVPPAISRVIHQALALSPSERFAGAAAMRLALHSAGGADTQILTGSEEGAAPLLHHNLPAQLTSFVGREAEVAAVQQLLRGGARLVTLTGPGGIGKTRLALTIATRSLSEFADGVFFVSLAPIVESALVLPTVAQTLGLRENVNLTSQQILQAHLQDKALLLLLDNFEQVVSSAPEISNLLVSAPRLKILVTSREALHVRGEQEFPVPALELPDLRQLPAPEAASQFAATRLFVQRAQAVKPDFVLHQGNVAAIAEICKRLDGLPLALELAAASVKFLPVQAILTRLAERVELPTRGLRDLPDRQRTLRASIGWSYDLLTVEEKSLFRRLSIFSGSFNLEAAEAMCRGTAIREELALEIIASLIGKSLVKALDTGESEPRFTLLETIREFGLDRLDEEGESDAVRAAHAAYFEQLVEKAGRGVWGAKVAHWVSRLEAEIENVRAALTYYLADAEGAEAALRLAGSLWRFWEMRGHIQEGRSWLDRALLRRAEVPPAGRWLALHGAGNLAIDQDEYAIGTAHYQESLELLEALLPSLQDPEEIVRIRHAIANTLTNLGNTATLQSQIEEAKEFTLKSMAILGELIAQRGMTRFNPYVGMGIATFNMAVLHLMQSEYREAEALAQEGLALYRQLGDERGLGWNLHRLGNIARDRGRYPEAAKYYQEAKTLFEKLSNQADMTTLYFDLGEATRQLGDDEKAETEYHYSLTLARAMGNKKEIAFPLDRLSRLAARRRSFSEAIQMNEESISLLREIGNLFGVSDALQTRGEIAFAQHDYSAAKAGFFESLKLKVSLGERKGIIDLFKALASLNLAEEGDPTYAARLLAAAEKMRVEIGIQVPPAEAGAEQSRLSITRARLGEADFAAAWSEGQALDLQQAVDYAIEERQP